MMRDLDGIERYIEQACELRTIHVTELATLMVELINSVRHEDGNLQQQITHHDTLIKGLQNKLDEFRKEHNEAN